MRHSTIGFLKLDTHFPRIYGDAGCAATWRFPVLYQTVAGGTPARVVQQQAAGLMPAFIAAGKQLIARGANGISTTCGFLALHQQTLAAALPAPVMSSALFYGKQLQTALPAGKILGILSASASDLSTDHLTAAGIDGDRVVIGGLPPDGVFARVLLENKKKLPVEAARQDMTAAATALFSRYPNIGAILLECTNMPPYAAAVKAATDVPVFSIIDAVCDFHHRLKIH